MSKIKCDKCGGINVEQNLKIIDEPVYTMSEIKEGANKIINELIQARLFGVKYLELYEL